MPYVSKHIATVTSKWASVHQMLRDREQQLELSTGAYQSFMEHAQDLLAWLRGRLDMGALSGSPPADLDVVEGYQREVEVNVCLLFVSCFLCLLFFFVSFLFASSCFLFLSCFLFDVLFCQVTKDELATRIASLKAMEHMASRLKGQVTPAIAEKLDKLLEETRGKWAELDKGTAIRKEGVCGGEAAAFKIVITLLVCLFVCLFLLTRQNCVLWLSVFASLSRRAPRQRHG